MKEPKSFYEAIEELSKATEELKIELKEAYSPTINQVINFFKTIGIFIILMIAIFFIPTKDLTQSPDND